MNSQFVCTFNAVITIFYGICIHIHIKTGEGTLMLFIITNDFVFICLYDSTLIMCCCA